MRSGRQSSSARVGGAPPSRATSPLELPVLLALGRYRGSGALHDLAEAFAAARVATAATRAEQGSPPPPGIANRRRFARLPAVEELIDVALVDAERAIRGRTAALWSSLGLRSSPPAWRPTDRATARRMLAMAIVADEHRELPAVSRGLRRVGTRHFAAALVEDLGAAPEGTWQRLLGERYESVVHRCAPRTGLRARRLAALVADAGPLREALVERLAAWLRDGAAPEALGPALEAVIVHYRTPVRRA